jgi:integrase
MIARRKKADGKNAYRVRVGDSPSKSFDLYQDAEQYEGELKRQRRRERAGLDEASKPNITFDALVQLWVGNFDPSAWRMDMIAYATARWGKVKVRDIQPEQLGAWLTSLTGKSGQALSTKTRSHVLETMRQVLNAGVEWGYLGKSPARRGVFKAPSQRSRIRPIRPFESWSEVELVADACPTLVGNCFVRFMCATGARPNELTSLMWSQVDLQGGTMTIGSKTAAGHRTVPLSRHARSALMDMPRSISGRVFHRKGKPFDYPNWRRTDWRLALASCGLERRTPYEMRHTFATLALAHGAAIDDVATVMGHDDISVAFNFYRKWIKLAADRLRSQLDTIDREDDSEPTRVHQRGD